MKAVKLYVGKEFLKEKLGIEENQFVIGEINGNSSFVEFTVFIDQDAITKGEMNTVKLNSNDDLNIRRNKI